MADQFQYVKLPDGSYGKFASDAGDDVIKSAISRDFPDAFPAAAKRPDYSVHPPHVPRPPFLRKTAEGDPNPQGLPATDSDYNAGAGRLFRQLLGQTTLDTAKGAATSMVRTSGPQVAYQAGRKLLGKPEDTRMGMGMPSAEEVGASALPFFMGPEAGIEAKAEGESAGGAAAASSPKPVGLVRSPSPTVARPGAAAGPSAISDLIELMPGGNKLKAGARLLKRGHDHLSSRNNGNGSNPLTDTVDAGERGGFQAPTEAEQTQSYRQQQFQQNSTSTARPPAGEANPPHDPVPVHTPSGGARLTLQKAATGAEDPTEYARRTGRVEPPSPVAPAENKVPKTRRASTLLKQDDQESIAKKVEGRGAAKADLERKVPTKPTKLKKKR